MPYIDPQKRHEYYRKYYLKRIEAGLCIGCGKPHSSGRKRCDDCRHRAAGNPSRQREYRRIEGRKQRQRMGDRLLAYRESYVFQLRLKVIDLLGGKCVNCNETKPIILTINHINGLQGERVKGRKLYFGIFNGKEDRTKYDLRCFNCQTLYEFERRKIFKSTWEADSEEMRKRHRP